MNATTLLQHTIGHHECPACAEIRAMYSCSITADLPFTRAGEIFMELRSVGATEGAITARYIKKNTEISYTRQIEALKLFFADMKMGDIHWFHMRAYQAARVAGNEPFHRYRRPQDAKPTKHGPAKGKTPCPAQPNQINQETGLLKRLKILAGCWTPEDEKYFEKLQQPDNEIPRALTPEQQALWVDISRCQERWNLVHWYSILAFHSCAGPNELRGLRLGDINMPQQLINVPWPSSKNKYRHRTIPIEESAALWALDRLLARAYDLGARQPDHYLFPFRTHRLIWLPEKGASGSFLKKAWEEVRAASKITWFRPYDTRHTAATRLAERGVPVDVIMARMGHASDFMRRHYTHISVQAQRRWLKPQPYTQHMYAPPVAQWPQQQYAEPQQPQQQRPELPEYLRYMHG